MDDRVKLSEGNGGKEMQELIASLSADFFTGDWRNTKTDAATFSLGNEKLFFTTDGYIVDPIFFAGGNIGKLAFCGTVNDLVVQGAKPLGISLSAIIEEGFSKEELRKIVGTISALSNEHGIPIVTGDTKVMPKGKVDKITLTTSGVGLGKKVVDEEVSIGDKIIVSGGLGEHAAVLLAARFEIETELETDCKALCDEMDAIRDAVKQVKDITRGGLAASLHEICGKHGALVYEEKIPLRKEVRAITSFLGIEPYDLACEGRLICVASPEMAELVVANLQKFNASACVIGEITAEDVVLKTSFGKRLLSLPSGNIVPRIC